MSPLRALLHPGVERLPADISAQKSICQSSVSHIYTDVNLRSLTKDNARNNNNRNNALKLLKTCTSIPFVAPVLPHCRPRCSLEPPPLVCPRTVLSLKGQQLHLCRASSQSCYPGSSLSPLTLSDCFAGPGQIHPSLPLLLLHFYLLCLFPKFHLPITCAFSFLCSITLPANTSLYLICFSYSLSHLSLPSPR